MAKPDLVYVTANASGNLFAETGLSSTHDTITVSGGGGGVSTFTALTDAPDSYDGFADNYVKVDRDGLALEFGQLNTGNLTDWNPFSEQILYYNGTDGLVQSRPDRGMAMQLVDAITAPFAGVDPDNGKCVKQITSNGAGTPNQAVSIENVGGGRAGTRNYIEFTSQANGADTILLTGSFAIITLNSGTGTRTVVGINDFTFTSQGAWVLLEWRSTAWGLIDRSPTGLTINLT